MKAEMNKRYPFTVTMEEARIMIDAMKCYKKWVSSKALIRKKIKLISERLYLAREGS